MCTLQHTLIVLIICHWDVLVPTQAGNIYMYCSKHTCTITTYNTSTRSFRTFRFIQNVCSTFLRGFARERMSYSVTEVQPNMLFIVYNLHSFPWKCFQLREVLIHFLGPLFLALPYCSPKCLEMQCHSMCTSLWHLKPLATAYEDLYKKKIQVSSVYCFGQLKNGIHDTTSMMQLKEKMTGVYTKYFLGLYLLLTVVVHSFLLVG